jgi:hypothetical protein
VRLNLPNSRKGGHSATAIEVRCYLLFFFFCFFMSCFLSDDFSLVYSWRLVRPCWVPLSAYAVAPEAKMHMILKQG